MNKQPRTRIETKYSKLFLVDVDGVLSNGQFMYSKWGKFLKTFGPDDADALKELASSVKVIFVSADQRGFKISQRRIQRDLGFDIYNRHTVGRVKWAREHFAISEIAYMGDSYLDIDNFSDADVAIAPADASRFLIPIADHVTVSPAANRAVADACFFLNDLWALKLNFPKI